MCVYVKLSLGGLNPNLYPPHSTSTYTCRVTIAPKVITSSYPIKSSFELVQYIGSLQSLTKIKLDQLDKLQMKLRSEGGIKALLGMVRCRHADVLAQVARGIANFAKCESRAATQGEKLIKAPS